MQRFNVLERNLDLHRNYLLEASAGTGKTFSIQNIVVRLLIESQADKIPLILRQILIVTFTRAATRDLKMRIRANIEKSVLLLKQWLSQSQQSLPAEAPDYLKAIMEQGPEIVNKAKNNLQRALIAFDEAQIFTIHSFCARMLKQYAIEGDLGMHAIGGEDPLPNSEILAVMRDFFRTEVNDSTYTPGQLKKLLKANNDLIRAANHQAEIEDVPGLQELFLQFKTVMHELKNAFSLNAQGLLADFEIQSKNYKNYASGITKDETSKSIGRFALLFDRIEWTMADFDLLIKDSLVWTLALDSALLKKGQQKIDDSLLNFPGFTEALAQKLFPIIEIAQDYSYLLAGMAKNFKMFLKRYQNEEEKLSPDDFLNKMHSALDQPAFAKLVQQNYQAVIIDEFQDTDPLQWHIFRRLFLPQDSSWNGRIYLVGDPKQSIYSFRQADIYTYLSAAKILGSSHCYSLDVNYRSHPHLVEGLNILFCEQNIPALIPLPKQAAHLPYHEVQAIDKISPLKYDGRGAIHFFMGESNSSDKPLEALENLVFFPFIVKEIMRLHDQNQLTFAQFAVLVRDRHQGARLASCFDRCGIPYLNQRRTNLMKSSALNALIDILRAVLHPKDQSAIKAALGSSILGWTNEDMQKNYSLESAIAQIYNLRSTLMEKGFSEFFQELMQGRWQQASSNVKEELLSRKGGIELYHDLQQLTDLINENHNQEWHRPEGIIPFLDELALLDDEDDERLKRAQDNSKEGVKILTLHYSKGLEFDVVFALGLVNRKKAREQLIPIENDQGKFLIPKAKDPKAFESYCEENDAEKMRQLYVAFTRAKYRLYVPVALGMPSHAVQIGEASPMDLFLARFNFPAADYREIYVRILNNQECLCEFLDRHSNPALTYSKHTSVSLDDVKFIQKDKEETLIPPKEMHFAHSSLYLTSYTGLSQRLADGSSPDLQMPHDFNNSHKNPHTLPANAETGILLHAILEKIDFQMPREEINSFIRPFIHNTPYSEWEEALVLLVCNALKTEISDTGVPLCGLESNMIYREMPFLFPFEHHSMLKGVIDLIFMHNGLYYIVDWKSNWLGNELADYALPHLENAMHMHDYYLQARIYKEALRRYVNIVDTRPFDECYGGTFYLFLRGMSVGQTTGIYKV